MPVLAALKVGDLAPDFSATASLAGQKFHFSLEKALKKGPVVVYFYPSAYTKGPTSKRTHSRREKDKFDAAGATIIGVSADSIARLDSFSADPNYCAGKFPVASDADRKIATSYDLTASSPKAGMTDVRGNALLITISSSAKPSSSAKITRSSPRFRRRTTSSRPTSTSRSRWPSCSNSPPDRAPAGSSFAPFRASVVLLPGQAGSAR